MATIKIQNGLIIDPANRAASAVGDVWIDGSQIVAPDHERRPDQTVDATGLVVMPGGVDMHSHFVGPKVNAARKLTARPLFGHGDADFTDRTRPFLPTVVQTGAHYCGLGYTTAFDAAVAPSFALQAQQEIHDMRQVDAGFFALVGNHRFVLEAICDADQQRVRQFLEFIITKTAAYAPKIVNPGGVDRWKSGVHSPLESIDERLPALSITPRDIIQSITAAANEIGLPHPVHIHCNQLGIPGNWRTTLETMKAVGDFRAHLAHVQFHSYRDADDEASFGSAVAPLVDYLNQHQNLSVDVGQIMFGNTMSMTADSPLGDYLRQISGSPWISYDTEFECGCGISPIKYRQRNRIHGLQWAIGLEWFLSADNPWQVALSTDHPNGASFLCYPEIMALLMDRDLRGQYLSRLHRDVLRHSLLQEMDREYTLEEIAIVTRAAPAKMLGLRHKGHLAPGADADVTIYDINTDRRAMFEFPRMVIKSGQVVMSDGKLLKSIPANRLESGIQFDVDSLDDVDRWFRKNYTARWFDAESAHAAS